MGNIIDGYVIHYSGDGDGMKDEKNSAKVSIITRISNLFQMCVLGPPRSFQKSCW